MLNTEQDVYRWSYNEKRMLKYMLENDGMQFMRYFFKLREGVKMLRNWHHYVIEYVLQAVFNAEINRLIINIAPGYTKTELAVVNFISRGLAINPNSRYIHISASKDLVSDNSVKVKDTITLPEFQELWPMVVRPDASAKGLWRNDHGGGMLAAAAGGQITGFRAGRMVEGFTGALIIDDPVKPDDAYSNVKRSAINNRFNNTMRSRLAVESIPMIVIMQRIHEDDMSGYLLKGGSGDIWHHLSIPALLSDEEVNKPYPQDYTHGKRLDIGQLLRDMHSGIGYAF